MSSLSKLLHLHLPRTGGHGQDDTRALDRAMAKAITESTRHELMTLAAVRNDR